MAYQQNDNSGSIFVNDKKETEKHPDRTGTAMIDGKEYWVSGWLRKTQNGDPWLSLAFKRKEGKGQPAKQPQRQAPRRNDPDDMSDVPF